MSGGEVKVVVDRRVRIGVVLPRYATVRGKLVEIWHVRVADDIVVALVLLDHNEDVPDFRYRCWSTLARCLGFRLWATEAQNEGDEGARLKMEKLHLTDGSLAA